MSRANIFFCLFFFILLYAPNQGFAESSSYSDSLKVKLRETLNKKSKADLLIALSIHYGRIDADTALIYANQAFNVSSDIKDDTLIATSLNQLGNIYNNKGMYDIALNFFFKALEYAERIDDKNRIARINNNIGIVYYHQQYFDKTLVYFKNTANSLIELGDTLGAIYAINNIAGVYHSLKDNEQALIYFNRGYDLSVAVGSESSQAILLTGIGTVHADEGQYDLALRELISALTVKRKGTNSNTIMHSLLAIGELYMQTEKYDSALLYMSELEDLAVGGGFINMQKDSYERLSNIYEKKGQTGKSLEYLKLHMAIKDSLSKDESEKTIAEIQAKYDNVQDEKKIELLKKNELIRKKELERKDAWNFFLIGGGVILLVFAVFIYVRLKDSRKKHKIISEQKILVDEKNREVLDSINYAKRIQQAMLKAEDHESKNLPEHFVLFKPKDIVSGDFYWAFENSDYFYLAAVDCTGHGVPGAFLTMLGTAFLNEIASRSEILSPGEILDELRGRIIKELGQTEKDKSNRDGMDISMIRINLKTMEGQWAGANNPLWLIRDSKNELEEIKADKQAIGFSAEMRPYQNHKIDFKTGDCFYLFSDGYVDQFGGESLDGNGKGKKFKSSRLKSLLLASSQKSMSEQLEILNNTFVSWRGDLEQVDDVCIIGMRL